MFKQAPGSDLSLGALGRWEPRVKVVGLLAIIFAFASVSDLRLLPVIAATAAAIFLLSTLPFSSLKSRLKVPGIFIAFMAVLLPFFSGETVLLQVGPVSLREEGSLAFASISTRFLSIVTVATVLFASTPMPAFTQALRSLGLPSLLADMLLFTYRYIFQLKDDLNRARTAARLRGTAFSQLRSIKTTAYIIGSLLVRSSWQADRVLSAMIVRGYGNTQTAQARPAPKTVDFAALAACVACAAALVVVQALLV